jgi:metal-responsive CopG/Arc/MetJ family transcriptional regulator
LVETTATPATASTDENVIASIAINKSLLKRADEAARREDRSRSSFVRRAIAEAIERSTGGAAAA